MNEFSRAKTARTPRIGVDLPVLVERLTSQQDGQQDCDPSHKDEPKPDKNPRPIVVQTLSESQIETAHSRFEDPEQECVC